MPNTIANINTLNTWFKKHPRVLVALSGGVDSCLMAYMARRELGKQNAVAVISNSASLKNKDLSDARQFADRYDIELIEIDANEINDKNYRANPVNRCYFCKTNLYQTMQELAQNAYPDYVIINGNNHDDLGDYRPGMQAADEFKVYSPLLECKINKDSIRHMSKHFNLSVWDKPASPCLSSRFPYGEAISAAKLLMVEKAEDYLNTNGFDEVRVRYINGMASLEVPKNEINTLQSMFTAEFKKQITDMGFTDAGIDEEGLVSGKLNRNIQTK
ncbi:uncharacterized protein SAMN06265379_102167 [Saccharicrinis carchari]|uniref:NAD/GMP synthase domain-containing protein n=1 Tax=Saccharicrinis carchari TaxID=1168039 RepID=A0A521BX78_SACCC|nr:ATP-dependent sacrificial sulfur transferase LarE [Saccharicrinis carchari]SMO51768.1 uncharacterized protein SAMN06265379_102167 [Saccharicrinis carchari]